MMLVEGVNCVGDRPEKPALGQEVTALPVGGTKTSRREGRRPPCLSPAALTVPTACFALRREPRQQLSHRLPTAVPRSTIVSYPNHYSLPRFPMMLTSFESRPTSQIAASSLLGKLGAVLEGKRSSMAYKLTHVISQFQQFCISQFQLK